jgi:hypothetical protein
MSREKEEKVKEKEEKKNSNNEVLVEKLLFQQAKKPKNTVQVKVVNVYDNRYRINVYVGIEENGFYKNKIDSSYFVKLKDEKLEIILGL